MAEALAMDADDAARYAAEAGDLQAAEVSAAMGKQRILSNQILSRRRKGRASKEESK
jgi:hypothetical protein